MRHEPRDKDYRQLAVRYRKVLQNLDRKSSATSARVQEDLARLAKDHHRVRDIDFFDAPDGAEVRRLEEASVMGKCRDNFVSIHIILLHRRFTSGTLLPGQHQK